MKNDFLNDKIMMEETHNVKDNLKSFKKFKPSLFNRDNGFKQVTETRRSKRRNLKMRDS